MTPPMQPQVPAAGPASDRTTLWGVLGIVIGFFCCPVVGIIFGILSMQDARRFGKPRTLGWLAIAASIVSIVLNGVLFASGSYPGR